MPEFQTIFRLGRRPGDGVFCDAAGLLVGDVALLERSLDEDDDQSWRPRPVIELNRDLSRCYGLPIQIEPKASGLEMVASALGRGDLAQAQAQMVALHLRFPDPPDLEKSASDVATLIDLARRLDASGLLNGPASSLATRQPRQRRRPIRPGGFATGRRSFRTAKRGSGGRSRRRAQNSAAACRKHRTYASSIFSACRTFDIWRFQWPIRPRAAKHRPVRSRPERWRLLSKRTGGGSS